MSINHFPDDTIDRLSQDIGRKLREKRAMVEGSEGPIIIKVFPRGNGFDIKVNVTG